ncbi:acyl-CoA carboxylase subunit epsilon [Streptomyces aquilus]|uniref:acyl-CoA carboxylase subunit epsilon n=1 Tax=Streptomyces aquilus TaxID=2548456 RepID=UPI0037CFF623
MSGGELLITVEKGHPDEAELAAVVTVLLSLQAGGEEAPDEPVLDDVRWWQGTDGYAAPDSWR